MRGDNLSLFKDNKGSAFIIVIISMAVLLILATTVASIASSNFEMGHAERRYQTAYYVAEAGIRHQIEHMRLRMEELHRSGGHTSAGTFFTAFNTQLIFNAQLIAAPLILPNLGSDEARADISVTSTPASGNPRTYTFTSSATVGNVRRTIQGSVTIEWALMQAPPVFFDRALFVDAQLKMDNHALITGGLATNATARDSIELDNHADIIGGVILGPGASTATIKQQGQIPSSEISFSQSIRQLPDIVFPTNLTPRGRIDLDNHQTQTINQSGSYSEIELSNHSQLTFDLRGGDLLIVVNGDIELDNSADILTIGDGRLYLFVQGTVELSNHATINDGRSPNHVIMFVRGSDIELDNHARMSGGIYAPNANLDMANHSLFTGSILADKGEIGNHARITYLESNRINPAGLTQFLAPTAGFIPPERMFIVNPWREP
jgi:type II secretory pathway pseudopilin PulG